MNEMKLFDRRLRAKVQPRAVSLRWWGSLDNLLAIPVSDKETGDRFVVGAETGQDVLTNGGVSTKV